MRKDDIASSFVTILMLLLLTCTTAGASPADAAANAKPATPAAQSLAKLKAAVMSADYRADIKELARLRDELAQWPNDRELAYLARYWSGFASWRMAINGVNHQMKAEELTTNLRNASTDFYSAIRLQNDFADAWVAAAMTNSWLATFSTGAGSDVEVRERVSLSQWLFARASALDPQNPRVLWAKGSFLLFIPESRGGSRARAIEVYRQMLAEAERRGTDPTSPLPDWGKPEALMSLAYTHFDQTPPDLIAAHSEAEAALKIVPDWSYVRDDLLPKIDHALHAEH